MRRSARDATAQALRTALDPKGEWIASVLAAADRRLGEVRRAMPDAAGLVIATDHEHARAYARLLSRICGEKVPTVLSDDPKASAVIEKFSASSGRWLVAVRMVSEGVDIPRLAVGVYATTTTTPLFFAQAVGRFVRAQAARRDGIDLHSERSHTAAARIADGGGARPRARPRRFTTRTTSSPQSVTCSPEPKRNRMKSGLSDGTFEALESAAHFDRVVFDGGEFGHMTEAGSQEEHDYLGLPGLLEPDQVAVLLKERQAQQVRQDKRLTSRARGVDR